MPMATLPNKTIEYRFVRGKNLGSTPANKKTPLREFKKCRWPESNRHVG